MLKDRLKVLNIVSQTAKEKDQKIDKLRNELETKHNIVSNLK